jgi:hypothetical protein
VRLLNDPLLGRRRFQLGDVDQTLAALGRGRIAFLLDWQLAVDRLLVRKRITGNKNSN